MARFSTGTGGATVVGTGSTEVLQENGGRQYALITNDSNEVIYLNLGASAVLNSGIRLAPNGGWLEITGENLFVGTIYAISTTGTKTLTTFEA